MSSSCQPSWSSIRRELKPFWMLVLGVFVYGILCIVFSRVVGSGGLVTPSSSIDNGLAVFTLVMLVMRITVLVVVPLVVTYRVVRRLFTLVHRRKPRTDDASR